MKSKLRTYASLPECARLKRLRARLEISQTVTAHALYTPLRTYQSWEDGKAKMHRVIWQAAMGLLEARAMAAQHESATQP